MQSHTDVTVVFRLRVVVVPLDTHVCRNVWHWFVADTDSLGALRRHLLAVFPRRSTHPHGVCSLAVAV